MILYARAAGRPPDVQRALRFCPASAGMTNRDLFRVALTKSPESVDRYKQWFYRCAISEQLGEACVEGVVIHVRQVFVRHREGPVEAQFAGQLLRMPE